MPVVDGLIVRHGTDKQHIPQSPTLGLLLQLLALRTGPDDDKLRLGNAGQALVCRVEDKL